MARKLYPTDFSEEPLIPAPKASSRPCTVDIREIVILFSAVAQGWSLASKSTRFCGKRCAHARGRASTPGGIIIDSQSVRTTEVVQAVGYDSGKLVKGHKRHILVDTLWLLQVVVNAANMPERAGAILLLEKVEDKFPRLGKIFSDGATTVLISLPQLKLVLVDFVETLFLTPKLYTKLLE